MARADIQTATYNPDERYSDFLMNFDKNPITGNLAKVTNEEAVKQAIKNLVLTNQGERLYNRTMGSKVRTSLFDPADAMTAEMIRTTIEQTITYHEPRANLLGVEIFDDSDNNAYKVNIYFNLINIPDVIQLDLILKRAR
jgi:phage baseplate assembly protein W